MQENYQKAVQAFIGMIEQGYKLLNIEQFSPEDFADNFGIEIDQKNLNAALDEAINQSCAYNDDEFWNN